MESRVLLTAAELDLFSLLGGEPLSLDDLIRLLGADRRPLAILLDALTAMELLEKRDDRYATPEALRAQLVSTSPSPLLPSLLHAANLWHLWSGLTKRVAGETASKSGEERNVPAFIGAMHVVASPQAARIVEAVAPGEARRLLDVGGASGTYSVAFLRSVPRMRATLFDLPEVVEIARARLAEEKLLDRVTLAPGDLRTDQLPKGHDLAFVSAIIHMNGPDENDALYRNVFQALVPGGRIVIRDHVMEPDRTRPRGGALFAVNMLVATENGSTYTFEEIAGGLTRAGFENVRLLQQGERMDALVDARRP